MNQVCTTYINFILLTRFIGIWDFNRNKVPDSSLADNAILKLSRKKLLYGAICQKVI